MTIPIEVDQPITHGAAIRLMLSPMESKKFFAPSRYKLRDLLLRRNFFPVCVFISTELIKERVMHSVLSKGLLTMVMGASLLAAGCATTADVQRAQATADAARMTADQAFAAAQSAQQRADQANAAAQQAQQSANSAQAAARDAAANAEQAKEDARAAQQVRLARGERG